jgi:hypothetical protein
MNRNRGGFQRAVATVAVGVAYCVAAGNAGAMQEINMKDMERAFVSGVPHWVDVLLNAEKGSEVTWFLLPEPGEGEVSADDALDQLSGVLAHTQGDRGAMSVAAMTDIGVINAMVPSMHGVAPKGLYYKLEGLGEQSSQLAMENPWVVPNYGAVPVSFAKAALQAGDVQWGPAHVATLFPAGKPLSPGAKFRLTEVPVQKAMEMLQDNGFEVVAHQMATAVAMGTTGGFSDEVEKCIAGSEKSSTPILECYNVYLGRDRDARLFEEIYKAVADDRYNYGPFMNSTLERVERLGLE